MKVSKSNSRPTKSNANGTKSSVSRKPATAQLGVPAAISSVEYARLPSIAGSGKVVIRRREFVGTATNGAVTGFGVTPLSSLIPGYDFNPSAPNMFPWLSKVAPAFERFRFNKLSFDFVPGQSTATAGRFYAAVDYDYDDAVTLNKTAFMGNMTAVESAVWLPCSLKCDSAALNRDLPYRYVSCTTRGLYVEARTANAGYLMVAFDTPTVNLLVDIWVNYEVEFVTPVNDAAIVQDLDIATAVSTTQLTNTVGTGFAAGVPMAPVPVAAGAIVPVKSGAFGVPTFNATIFGANLAASEALDISSARKRGGIGLFGKFNVTGTAPNTMLGADLADFMWAANDSAGNYLGLLSAIIDNHRSLGPITGGGGTVGGFVYSAMSGVLESIFSTFPTVRYLVPFLKHGTGAYGAGSSCAGFTYSDA